jgi:DNA-binding protein HU-beta
MSDPMATKPATKATTLTSPAKKAAAKPTPKAAAPKKAAALRKAEVITLKSLFEKLGMDHELPKKQAQDLAAGLVEAITTHLVSGDKIRMSGIGILEVKDRPARTGRNPATGESIQIAASKKIAFRAAKELKAAV